MKLIENEHDLAASIEEFTLLSDGQIIKRVIEGEIALFEIIMRRHNQRLYRVARSILKDEDEAMDVVQESYLKAYRDLEKIKDTNDFPAWISKIVNNEALMRLRKNSRLDYSLDDTMTTRDEAASDFEKPFAKMANHQLRLLLESAIDSLPVVNRSVFIMRSVQQLSTRETAMSLDISEDVVKTRYLRSKIALRKKLDAQIATAGLSVHEFAGHRCDSIVSTVLNKLTIRLVK